VSFGKVADCRGKLSKNSKDKGFFYCTKFSVGKGQGFKSYYEANFVRFKTIESMEKVFTEAEKK